MKKMLKTQKIDRARDYWHARQKQSSPPPIRKQLLPYTADKTFQNPGYAHVTPI